MSSRGPNATYQEASGWNGGVRHMWLGRMRWRRPIGRWLRQGHLRFENLMNNLVSLAKLPQLIPTYSWRRCLCRRTVGIVDS